MAEEKVETRELTWRQLLPWAELFRGFQVALDLNKLLLAAGGILAMAIGWSLLSMIFAVNADKVPPDWPGKYTEWADFRSDRLHWNLMHEAANVGEGREHKYEVKDFAETPAEVKMFSEIKPPAGPATARELEALLIRLEGDGVTVKTKEDGKEVSKTYKITPEEARRYRAKYARLGQVKPAGRLSVWPWAEDRGPNPYLLLTGQAGIPWEPGHFWDWFTRDQVLVMIEPLVKFARPVIYFFSPRNDFLSRFYFLTVALWTLVTWSFFGGAITRIAAVQVARGEKIGLTEALQFTLKRFASYVTAPLFPLVFVFALMVFLAIFGLLHMIPVLGDLLVDGLLWPIPVVLGLVMAVTLVGLVGWPLMSATISAEGTDSWEAVSRSYSYVFQRPWHYGWYALVAICYGAVLVFFVGLMGSLSVYLAKWGVARIQPASREPSFLFVYAPTSFGWRELLLEGTQVDGAPLVRDRAESAREVGTAGGVDRWNRIDPAAYAKYLDPNREDPLKWWNRAGAVLVAFWLGLMFLLVLGFGYSYFWSASTIVYLLLRRNVDAAELDEVYLEEDDLEGSFGMPAAAPPTAVTAAPARPSQSLPLVEAPPPRPTMPAAPPPPPPVAEKPPEAVTVAPPPLPEEAPPPEGRPASGDGTAPPL